MKYIIFLIFNCSLAYSNTEAISMLNSINTELGNKSATNACPEEQNQDFTPHTFVDASKNHQIKYSCKSLEGLTSEIDSYTRYFGQLYCKSQFGNSGYNCSETNQEMIDSRANDKVLMNRIIDFTKEKFESYKISLRDECCHDKSQKCYQRFNELKLEVPNNNITNAHYNFTVSHHNLTYNSIEITTLKLASEYTQEGIERLLLHEMGHVCHVALVSEKTTADFNRFAQNETKCTQEVGEEYFYNFDKNVQSCLLKNLEKQIKKNPNTSDKYCYGKWYREAAAEMMFKHRMDSIYHWIKPAYSDIRVSKNNSNIYELHDCVKENLPKDQVCSAK